jgi:hypothetical protein
MTSDHHSYDRSLRHHERRPSKLREAYDDRSARNDQPEHNPIANSFRSKEDARTRSRAPSLHSSAKKMDRRSQPHDDRKVADYQLEISPLDSHRRSRDEVCTRSRAPSLHFVARTTDSRSLEYPPPPIPRRPSINRDPTHDTHSESGSHATRRRYSSAGRERKLDYPPAPVPGKTDSERRGELRASRGSRLIENELRHSSSAPEYLLEYPPPPHRHHRVQDKERRPSSTARKDQLEYPPPPPKCLPHTKGPTIHSESDQDGRSYQRGIQSSTVQKQQPGYPPAYEYPDPPTVAYDYAPSPGDRFIRPAKFASPSPQRLADQIVKKEVPSRSLIPTHDRQDDTGSVIGEWKAFLNGETGGAELDDIRYQLEVESHRRAWSAMAKYPPSQYYGYGEVYDPGYPHPEHGRMIYYAHGWPERGGI